MTPSCDSWCHALLTMKGIRLPPEVIDVEVAVFLVMMNRFRASCGFID